jgi:hypothetical protein
LKAQKYFHDGNQGPLGAWQGRKEVKMLDFTREMNQKTSFYHLK